jgi:SAV_6107-like HEPN
MTLLESAREGLEAGKHGTSAASRYAAAHLAALHAAAAVVAAKSESGPTGRRKRPGNVWELLPRVQPALSGWATYFAAGATRRVTADGGLPVSVSLQEADKLLRDAEAFVSLAECAVGVTVQSSPRTK